MLYYNEKNKANARSLRNNLTDAENLLWFHLRRKQIRGIQFYRQKPIGNYIADFYAPSQRLIIEVDGGQHFEEPYIQQDKKRDHYFQTLGLQVLRFDNLEVLLSIDSVLEVVFENVR